MRTSEALSNLEITCPTGRVYILEIFYLSEGLAFNDFVRTYYSIFFYSLFLLSWFSESQNRTKTNMRKCLRYICLRYFKEQLYDDYKRDNYYSLCPLFFIKFLFSTK